MEQRQTVELELISAFGGLTIPVQDFISYAFGIYSSTIVDVITGGDQALTTTFGWAVVSKSSAEAAARRR